MSNRGLIFIPDISGFTRFVNQMEIDHSRHIISELLEVIINANELGLEISEIEGDAILFYKYGEAPQLDKIYRQVEKMFCAFHSHLELYDHRKLCQCNACTGAAELTLKVVTHYGEFTGYTVKNFNKLIGKDIIVAHQLLKNDIEKHEYWLITDGLTSEDSSGKLREFKWEESRKETEQGEIPFWYFSLTHLREKLPPPPPLDLNIRNKERVMIVTRDYETDLLTLLHAVVDFPNRKYWQPGVKEITDISDPHLMRLGTKYRCILEKGQSVMCTSAYSFTADKIEYTETSDKKDVSMYFIFEKLDGGKSRLQIEFFIKKNPIGKLWFNLKEKRKLEKSLERGLVNIGKLIRQEEPEQVK